MPPKILIFGTGGVGAGYAYVLLRNLPSQNVVTVCRSNYDAASQNGFTMDSTIWGNNLSFKPTVVRTVNDAVTLDNSVPFDYVVVTSKVLRAGLSNPELIKSAISRDTTIVLLQNGIGIEDEYTSLYPDNPLLSAVVYFAVTQTSPAVLSHSEIELMHVGTYPANAPAPHKRAAESWVQLVTDCGATIKLHDDVQSERWAKLMLNAPINPLCALTRSRDTQFLNSGDGTSDFIRDTIAEVLSVAHAYGYTQLNQQRMDNVMYRMSNRAPPGVQPSMMADALAHRNMEVDAIVGNVVRLAQQKNVNVPILRTFYMLVRALDDSFTRSRRSV
ncbi:hypothetical protein LTR64_002020 [Lithohypha guttulata]|uniref:uncharacterized protein n=1 Tax=Lithohypha guttulata TaxID=1690604 RepID=UPI002DE11714|nr:hypothetical protein LTR51_007879 [Lithohypha guttulata]